jgi:putative heme-binding domain-containing protein
LYKILLLWLVVGCQQPEDPEKTSEDQFAKHIRTTEANSPQDQLKLFNLPPGFKIALFASEPDIGKPMNLSFDAQGRLWVTQSQAYPFQDSTGASADRITILEDRDNDGRADKFTVFADSLNIPIGIMPVLDGAIAYSIPYVYHLVDSDGDDKADQRNVLLSGFEYQDTHGMINNFFRGLDGWIHANHGFSNVSEVVGTDHKAPLRMQSGNTFRFRPDGTGVQFTTTGRVNPFGYALDDFGYLYSVDCHSSPIYQLIRGADYPHFGKKSTGIGFGPAMMPHNYGSTALAGLEYYTGHQFPETHQKSFYLGDVVKSRVYQATIEMTGTTPVPQWESDFIISEDPWFRPVDIKLGPDGALYIADFYNRIIGHYEVPLDHPGRDRERGRIWRVTYEENGDLHQSVDWSKKELPELIDGLKDPSLTVRMMVADQIVDRFGEQAVPSVVRLMDSPDASTEQFIHGMWILFRLEKMDQRFIVMALNHSSDLVRVHLLHILFEMESLNEGMLDQLRMLVDHENPHISRAVVMILAKYPSIEQVYLLLARSTAIKHEDTHQAYVLKQALRDHLRDAPTLAQVNKSQWDEVQLPLLAAAMVGVEQVQAAQFLANNLEGLQAAPDQLANYANHIARLIPESEFGQFEVHLRSVSGDDFNLQYKVLQAMQNGLAQRGNKSQYGKSWAIELATSILQQPPVPSENGGEIGEIDKQQIFACEVAGNYQIDSLEPELARLLQTAEIYHELRTAAATALLSISEGNFGLVAKVAQDLQQPDQLREELHLILVDQETDEAYELATNVINGLSFDTQKKMVMSMSGTQQGITEVLQVAQSMDISPKMLLEPSIQSVLLSNMDNQQKVAYNKITHDLVPFSVDNQRLIRERLSGYQSANKSMASGATVFDQQCASCHQIGGKGGNIGPQLDGIGNRGVAALTEKILDPNRSISKSFVNYSLTLNDGTIKQGLFRREEGNLRVFADISGAEFSISVDEIDQQTALPFTLMPDNFSSTISESDYYHLLYYLSEQK